MKKTDIALIIFIAGISILIAYFVAKAIIGDPGEQKATVRTAVPIGDTIDAPGKEIFNDNAINPTVEVVIGEDGKVIDTGTDDGEDLDSADTDNDKDTSTTDSAKSDSSRNGGSGAKSQ
jgi:hypothetical protein